jgi:hypothetical protein
MSIYKISLLPLRLCFLPFHLIIYVQGLSQLVEVNNSVIELVQKVLQERTIIMLVITFYFLSQGATILYFLICERLYA